MKPIAVCLVTLALCCSLSLAQTAPSAQPQASAQADANRSAAASDKAAPSSVGLAEGSTIDVALNKSLDAKKNKPGDEVMAKTTEAVKTARDLTIPKGSKVIGHVTEAQARTKAQAESKLGVAFDRFVLKDGSQIPVSASIQAIAQAEAPATASGGYEEPAMSPSAGDMGAGGNMGGRTGYPSSGGARATSPGGTLGQATSTVSNTASQVGQAAGVSSAGQLSAASHGVIGLNGLSLEAQGNASQGSVISSEHQNVHLDSGTRILLRVNAK